MADASACILINIGELDGIRFPIFYCANNYISAVFKKFQALIQSMMKSKKSRLLKKGIRLWRQYQSTKVIIKNELSYDINYY